MEYDRNRKALTQPFSETVKARIERDPEFRTAVALEAKSLFDSGEPAVARRVLSIADFTEVDMALIAAAKVPDEYAYLDEELEGWQPDLRQIHQDT